ncbi:hypothetical protein [Portibacter lacus]|uniref:Outer membrane protein beta-barrel domain-containing protein n=1 Tax=Portibacter lacus TaxID=1099794 RepID=A0AA37WEV5_9BACT|nr:hypothetical protein [Portibacter lacus]GLR19166.1 hypothetical protein GCM10007940_37820 [Portibacter lacus]
MKKITLILSIVLLGLSINAQKDETIFGQSGIRFTGIWGGSTTSINGFQDDFDFIGGGFFAFEFNKSLLLGWDNYEMRSTLNDGGKFSLTTHNFLVGYTPYSYKSFHPYFYTSVGNGIADVKSEGRDRILSVQPSIGLELNVFRWLRISLDGGYRFISGSDFTSVSDQMLSSPFVGVRAKFGWSWGR